MTHARYDPTLWEPTLWDPTPWPPDPAPVLEAGGVGIWLADLDSIPPREGFVDVLDDDERSRAERFHFDADRIRYVASHVILRHILTAVTGVTPRAVEFTAGPNGKPSLVGGGDIRFNMSHSETIAIYAVAHGREVGVDIEHVKDDFDFDGVAGRFFSPREIDMLARLGDAERKLAFFAVWTRKEAILKASGGGLSVPLDSFTVSLEPVSTVTLPADKPAAGRTPQWTLLDISPAKGARAALAVEGDLSVPLQCRQLILPR